MPENTDVISSEIKQCESNLDYCYIDTHYKTHCNNELYNGYPLKYKDTKIYFNSCENSEYFFNIKTYHFQGVCYEECPKNTEPNDANGECECIYYKNYIDKANDIFECLNETDLCKNHNNKYSKTDVKICAESRQECITENYKIFNSFCYKSCPVNTVLVDDNCECQYHYYIKDGEYLCFSQEKSCEDTQYPIQSNTNRCFLSKEECISEGNKFFNNKCYINSCPEDTDDSDNDGICFCSYFYYKDLETGEYICLSQSEQCQTKDYDYKIDEEKQCFNSLEDCGQKGFKTFNGQCYKECPSNTNDINNDGICTCSYFYYYDSGTNLYTCYGKDETCESKGHTKQIDSMRQCFNNLDDCKLKGFKIFNNECYESCPDNTNDNDNNAVCSCSYFYYKDMNTDLYYCLGENDQCTTKGYIYKNNDEKQCFSSLEDCKEKGFKFFNDECYRTCPVNTYEKDSDKICYCSNFFYKNFDTGLYNCLAENEECVSKGYTKQIANIKQCFSSLDDCKVKGFKVFNNECFNSCPENTYEKADNIGVCYCLNFYFYNLETGLYDCLAETETCQSREYLYKIEDKKQCFISFDDCKAKGFNIFNNECLNSCPENTKNDEIDNSKCSCKNYYFYIEEQNKYDFFDNDKICITANEEYKYTNIETKECLKIKSRL